MSHVAEISQECGWSDFLKEPFFSELDRRFGEFLAERDGGKSSLLPVAATLVSYQLARGHVFLDLATSPEWEDDSIVAPSWPDPGTWMSDLRKSSAVGTPGENRPLILLDSGKLYLQRYWAYEKLLAEKLREFTEAKSSAEIDLAELDQLFGDAPEQKEAGRNALTRLFSVISGGPGTGKTTTVLKILLLLLERDPETAIRLTAPTGKAAARLQESIRNGLRALNPKPELREKIERLEAMTIHRLLGAIGGSVYFRHHAKNPLAAEVVVLDEASMVDLPLMAKLFDALPPDCRLIMLGDKDQLASVEAGSVFTGIVEAATEKNGNDAPPLAGTATLLKKNFRFGNESGIFDLCNRIREGDDAGAFARISEGGEDIAWEELPSAEELKEVLRPRVIAGYRDLISEKDPAKALKAFGKFQVLTALRRGPYGKEQINFLIEEIFREEGWVPAGKRHYPGRALMVMENDYSVRLFNGDIGILLEDEEGRLMAFFESEDGNIRRISPVRLPFAEPAFAMTVHKSQGSEFDQVFMVLPSRDTRILTRELIYTAVSRARSYAVVCGTEEIFRAAVSRRVRRGSGLAEMLETDLSTE